MASLIRFIFKITLLAAGPLVFTAQNSNGQGRNEEITIIAPYIPSIQNASKIPFRPEAGPIEQEVHEFDYQYINKSIPVTTELDPVAPMKFSEDKQEELNGNYLKAGLGNYTTPYLEFLASSKQSEKYLVGVRLKHHSSQGGIKNYTSSAFSHNLISASGAAFFDPGTISANIGYNRDVVHYYGLPTDSFPNLEIDEDELKQRFQHFNISLGFKGQNNSAKKLEYHAGMGFHFFNDRFGTKETQFDLKAGADKQFSSSGKDFRHGLKIGAGLQHFRYEDSLASYSPLIINAMSIYHFGIGQYDFEVGLDLFLVTGDHPGESNATFNAFPHLRVEIPLIEDQLKVYAQLGGTKRINSYRGLSGINPFITSTPLVLNTDEQFRIFGGLTGSISGLNYNVEASYSFNENQPLFVNDTSIVLENKFEVIYDDVSILNIKGSIGILKIDNLQVRLDLALNSYIPKNEEKAWHLPSYEIGLDAGYTIQERYILNGYFMVLGSRYARDFDESGTIAVKLKPAVDLNLGFEYRITPKISVFASVNNILNQHYQRWYQYPVQGIQGMIGGKFSF
jgi:outer membrane receptor protein involved in Fe transport